MGKYGTFARRCHQNCASRAAGSVRSSIVEKHQRTALPVKVTERIAEAIHARCCVAFTYRGQRRFVEPQSVGVSASGHVLLRGYERSKWTGALKLYDVRKMERLHKTRIAFPQARPGHNPHDSAMSPVIASLPLPG